MLMQLTMANVVTDIIKSGIDAAKAAIPGATVLGAVADSTLEALKKEPEAIKFSNYEVTKTKGVKLWRIALRATEEWSGTDHDCASIDSNVRKRRWQGGFFRLEDIGLNTFARLLSRTDRFVILTSNEEVKQCSVCTDDDSR